MLKAKTGEDFPAADVRVAAQSAIFESAPLDRYLNASARKLKTEDRVSIAEALAEVINSDGRVSNLEIAFFNEVAGALKLTPAQLMGLQAEE